MNPNLFKQMIDEFPDMVHCVDADGTILMVNKAEADVLGYERGELIGRNVMDLYDKTIAMALKSGFEELKERSKEGFVGESLLRAKDGTPIPAEIRTQCVRDPDNQEFLHTVTVCRDLRKEKAWEDRVEANTAMIDLGSFTIGITHDLSNMLFPVSYEARLLADNPQFRENESVEQILQSARQMQEIFDELKRFVTGKELVSSFLLWQCCERAVKVQQYKISRSGVRLHWSLSPMAEDIQLQGIEMDLRRIFANLVVNACDAMIDSAERSLSISIDSGMDEDGTKQGIVAFKDTGSGIEPSVQQSLFDFGVSSKGEKGTGIGLWYARRVVESELGGKISVDSEPGVGTTFRVMLPVK